MPISAIAQVFLRLFAFNWVLNGLAHTATLAISIPREGFSGYTLTTALWFLVIGLATWFAAPALSRLFTRRNDAPVTLQGITLRQLYATTFIGLGLYFALSSFARIFSWLHYFAVTNSGTSPYHNANPPSYYELTEPLMTLAAAIFVIVTSDTWTRRLSRRHESAVGTPDPASS